MFQANDQLILELKQNEITKNWHYRTLRMWN